MSEPTVAGKVCIGFSKPYVALYANNAGTITYTQGRKLARGVSVDLSVDTGDDKKFYADDGTAESATGKFKKGTLKLTVDGLHTSAEKMIAGLPTATEFTVGSGTVDAYYYGDDQDPPYVGVGHIIHYMAAGTEYWTPIVYLKCKFQNVNINAKTMEEEIDWQTQDLNAILHRADDAKHNWRVLFEDQTSEDAAENVIKAFFSIS